MTRAEGRTQGAPTRPGYVVQRMVWRWQHRQTSVEAAKPKRRVKWQHGPAMGRHTGFERAEHEYGERDIPFGVGRLCVTKADPPKGEDMAVQK